MNNLKAASLQFLRTPDERRPAQAVARPAPCPAPTPAAGRTARGLAQVLLAVVMTVFVAGIGPAFAQSTKGDRATVLALDSTPQEAPAATTTPGATDIPAPAPEATDTPDAAAAPDPFANPVIIFPQRNTGPALPGGVRPLRALPYAPPVSRTPDPGLHQGQLVITARLIPSGPVLRDGVVWRIYSETIGPDGRLDLVATGTGGTGLFDLDPGTYLVHTAFGHAGTTKRVTIGRSRHSETVILNAGGLRLNAVVAKTIPLQGDNIRFDIYEMDFNERGERRMVARGLRTGTIARLNVGTYHVVSRYGDVNAVVRADIRVEPGKLVDATIYHNAARVTLKLVNEAGGEALANTRWSVLTPGGDSVVEGTGAFPSYVLAAGNYTVIARHQEKVFSHEFEVNAGRDGEVEVTATTAAGDTD